MDPSGFNGPFKKNDGLKIPSQPLMSNLIIRRMALRHKRTTQLPPSPTLRQVVRGNRRRERADGNRSSASATSESILILLQLW